MRLVGVELLKMRTAPRTLLGLTLALVALIALGSASTASSAAGSPFASQEALWDVLDASALSNVFTLILGILIVTWEYRHGTITSTFLAAPRRERVLAAKVAAAAVVGAALAALAAAVAVAVALVWIDPEVQRGQVELVARIVYGSAAWAVLGVGLGAIVQTQLGAIVIAFVWFLVAEQLLAIRFDDLVDYLPGAALDRLVGTGTVDVSPGGDVTYPFSVAVAAVIVTAYALAAAAVGAVAANRRDVA